MTGPAIGVDFGTTNSVVASRGPDGVTRTLRLPRHEADVIRSVLCFWREGGVLAHAIGPEAIAQYLEDPLASRLILSLKSHLASRSFTETRIHGRGFPAERLVSLFLGGLLAEAPAGARIVAGRPVRFVGETADDTLGEARLRAGFAGAGWPDISLALEPEAAGYRFAQSLEGAATVLVADFGGGTSDFSLLRMEPGAPVTAIGHAGLGVAGDALDARIMENVVTPLLGKGGSYAPGGTSLPIPPHWYSGFAQWHRLSMMRAPKMLRDIAEVARSAEEPDKLRHLLALIEGEAGYGLYRAVAGVKAALSEASSATLRFAEEGFHIEAPITRAEFEGWIAPDLSRMAAAVEQAVKGERVDRVFLTGGTSLVPAVRAIFEERFGVKRVSAGGEFVSVAEGLALIGAG
ncbi:MAG TPA: Hsp70 family protein [Roseococcus sp.]|nr:Hsp70 family protein [Roseococcus sp.]